LPASLLSPPLFVAPSMCSIREEREHLHLLYLILGVHRTNVTKHPGPT
jgi:hypothetical protein